MKFENVKIGVHPINWTNDDMKDLGDEYSFEDIINQAQEAGYEGIELGRKFPTDPEVLKAELAKRELVLTGAWCDTMFADKDLYDEYMEAFKKKVKFLKESGALFAIAAEGTGSTSWDPALTKPREHVQKLDDKQWDLFCKGLNEAGEFCNSIGMTLVYHVHTGTVIETYEETKRLCDNTDKDKVSLLMDTGHLHFCDVDIVKFVNDFGDRIKYVHLKNIREIVLDVVKEYNIDFNSAVKCGIFTVPGDAGIDYKPIMKALYDANYSGWMIVEAEQYLPSPSALDFAKMARKYIKEQTGC